MFRDLLLLCLFATIGLGFSAHTEAVASPNSTVAGDSAPEEPAPPLANEKKELEQKICATSKGQNFTELDSDKGPKKIVVTEKKIEEFPENVTKEVTVTRKAEKGPSNETQENVVVERKTVQDIDSGNGKQKNITIEIEAENVICHNTTDQETNQTKHELESEVEHLTHGEPVVANQTKHDLESKVEHLTHGEPVVANQTKHDLETEIEHLKHEGEKVKVELKKEEAETGKVVPVNETEVVNKTKETKTGKVVPETEEIEKEIKEQLTCDECRKELATLESINKKLLAALKKTLMRMNPRMREQTAKEIIKETSAEEKPVNTTHAEAKTPDAAKTQQEAVEKVIITKEETKA